MDTRCNFQVARDVAGNVASCVCAFTGYVSTVGNFRNFVPGPVSAFYVFIFQEQVILIVSLYVTYAFVMSLS